MSLKSAPAVRTASPRARTRRRHKGLWIVLVLLVALVAWNVVERLTRPTPDTEPPTLARSTSATGDLGTDLPADSTPARTAVQVENAFLAGDTAMACRYEADPAECAAIHAGAPRYDLTTAVSVVQAESLTGADGTDYVGVVVQRQITGQTLQRKAYLLTADAPEQVVADDLLGSSDTGKSLAHVFSEELR